MLHLQQSLYILWEWAWTGEWTGLGAGHDYYADIPQFGKYVNGSHFHTQFPMWFHIALFLIWGGVMYKFWIWLDKN